MKKLAPIDKVCGWSNKAGLTSYCVMKGDEHVATINFKNNRRVGRVYVIAFAMVLGKRIPFEGSAGGGNYDKHTAALVGFSLYACIIQDIGLSWRQQLEAHGLTVIQTL